MVEPDDFFRSSRFKRWVLVPLLVAFGVVMPLTQESWTLERACIHVVVSGAALLYALALLFPGRFAWASRAVALLVFLAYAAYFAHEWLVSDEPFRLFESRSSSSPRNALLGLVVIGLPALVYALRPRKPGGAAHLPADSGDVDEAG